MPEKAVIARFVGGPLDGTQRALPDARPTWYFPAQPPLGTLLEGSADEPLPRLKAHVYRRNPIDPFDRMQLDAVRFYYEGIG